MIRRDNDDATEDRSDQTIAESFGNRSRRTRRYTSIRVNLHVYSSYKRDIHETHCNLVREDSS